MNATSRDAKRRDARPMADSATEHAGEEPVQPRTALLARSAGLDADARGSGSDHVARSEVALRGALVLSVLTEKEPCLVERHLAADVMQSGEALARAH